VKPGHRRHPSISAAGARKLTDLSTSVEPLSSGQRILAQLGAVWAIDARDSLPGEQWALNSGTGGQVLRARYGTTGRAEVRNGVLYLPGTAGNYASVPDSAATSPTNDIEIVARIAFDRWDAPQAIFNKQQSFSFLAWGSGILRLSVTADGSTYTDADSTAHGFVAGQCYWVKVTRVRSTGLTSFFWSPDQTSEPGVWTAIGTSTQSAGAAPFDNAQATEIGSVNGGTAYLTAGGVSRAMLRTTLGGPTVLNVDFAGCRDLASSFVCPTGQTVTIVAAAAAADVSDSPLLDHNGSNYVHIPPTGLNSVTVDNTTTTLNITGDIEIVARISTAFSVSSHCRIWTRQAGNFGVDFTLFGGAVYCSWGDGATYRLNDAAVTIPGAPADGSVIWLKITRVAATGRITAAVQPDGPTEPTSWGAPGMSGGGTPGAVAYSAGDASIGYLCGKPSSFYRVLARNGIGGPTVLDVDFTRNTNQSSFVCATGQSVTFVRAASGPKTVMVTRRTWLFGTDDRLEVADSPALNIGAGAAYTVLAITRDFGNPAATQQILAKNAYGGVGFPSYNLARSNTGNGRVPYQNTTADSYWYGDPTTAPPADGTVHLTALTRSGTTVVAYSNATPVAVAGGGTVGDRSGAITSTTALRIGTNHPSAGTYDGEIYAAALFARALTAVEIAAIVADFTR
jgi:hypothetical protein